MEDKLDISSFSTVCDAFLSLHNLQNYASEIGSTMGHVDFSHIQNVSGDELAKAGLCLNSTCGINGATSGLKPVYDNLYKTVNILFKSEVEALGLFNADQIEDVDFSAVLLKSQSESSSFGENIFERALISELFNGERLKELENDGLFGANQSGPLKLLGKAVLNPKELTDVEKLQLEDLKAIFQKYGYITEKGYWNHSMYEFIMASRQSGCGFAANTNIIVDMYSKIKNGEELFYQKYGFPLYYTDEEGKKYYNYDALLASHYLTSIDNYSKQVIPGVDIEIPSFWPKWNPSFINYFLEQEGGIANFQRLNALQNEFPDVSMKTTDYLLKTDVEQYSGEYSIHDYAVVSVHNDFTLIGMDGESETFNGGHFMCITGVMPDGRYIVASWGKQFILDSYDFADLFFIDMG